MNKYIIQLIELGFRIEFMYKDSSSRIVLVVANYPDRRKMGNILTYEQFIDPYGYELFFKEFHYKIINSLSPLHKYLIDNEQ